MATLTGMGFPEIRCQKALLATGNTADAEAAMNWLFQHMEDADIDDPIVPAAASTSAALVDDATVSLICDMGFSPAQARQALRETGGSADRAVDWLFNHPDATGDDATAAPTAGEVGTSATTSADRPGSSATPATYKLKAFISHKGPSVHSGHYVAHVDEGDGVGWVLFNDEKVVRAEGGAQSAEKLAPQAYLYVYTRV
jgi:ubiquitin carboxyl-terminal hydrolase 5/13